MPPIPRGVAALLLTALIPALVSCGALQSPELEVGPGALQLNSQSPVAELLISNTGTPGSILRWSANDGSTLVHVSPVEGVVNAGQPQRVRISVDFSKLDSGTSVTATVRITSNAGSVDLPVSFLMSHTPACTASQDVALASNGDSRFLATAAHPGRAAGAFVPGELLVGYHEPLGPLSLGGERDFTSLSREVAADYGLLSLAGSGDLPLSRVKAADPLSAAQALAQDPRVAFAHPNYYLDTLALPNDPCLFDQWHLQQFGVAGAWELAGNERVVVAVIDTGVDTAHEDLANKMLPGYDFFDDDDDPNPGSPSIYAAHGTHVAGVALAQGNNGIGVSGVAFGSQTLLLPVKIFDDDGLEATTSDLVDAILWSAGFEVPGVPRNRHPADIINMSLGAGNARIPAVDWATERAHAAGSLLIAAAGNNGSLEGGHGVQSPANSPFVLAVGSVDDDQKRSQFSDWGDDENSVDLMAPGGYGPASCRRVRSTVPWSNYGCMAGTSMAAPFVAGVAALVLATDPDLSVERLSARITGSAYFDSNSMNEQEYGNGVVCASRAVAGLTVSAFAPCP